MAFQRREHLCCLRVRRDLLLLHTLHYQDEILPPGIVLPETISRYLFEQHPREVTLEWAVEKRTGKVFLDYNQNVRGKTLACAYSPRPSPEATVSTPVRWEEVGEVYPTDFTILNVPQRLAQVGDLWADILQAKRDLKGLLESSKT
ncbi:MAG: hypothetical protein V1849_03715 [Chloroflexota bacterium]